MFYFWSACPLAKCAILMGEVSTLRPSKPLILLCGVPCLAVAPCLSVQEGSSATILPHRSLVGQTQQAAGRIFVSSLC